MNSHKLAKGVPQHQFEVKQVELVSHAKVAGQVAMIEVADLHEEKCLLYGWMKPESLDHYVKLPQYELRA